MQTLQYRIKKHGVTQSILTDYLKCRQYAKFKLKGIRPSWGSSKALVIGDLTHEVLGTVAGRAKRPKSKKIKLFTSRIARRKNITDLDIVELVKLLSVRYFKRWKSDFKRFNWVNVEGEFLNKYKGFPLRGKYDGVFKLDGDTWLLETKTKSQVQKSDLTSLLSFDFQVMFYLFNLYLTTGKFPKGILYNIIRKPQLYKRKGDSTKAHMLRCRDDMKKRPDHYFIRFELAISKHEIKSWVATDLNPLLKEFKAWRCGNVPTIKNTNACQSKYGLCEYAQICGQGITTNYIIANRFHPELGKERANGTS